MVTVRRWTNEEEEILVQAIKANPHNIADAFKHASIKLEGRTVCACRLHWYKIIAPSNNPTKIEGTAANSLAKPKETNLWMKIKRFIGLK